METIPFGWFGSLQLWTTGDLQLHHNNAPVQCITLAKHQITQVTQSPYSLDLASCDFWLFPKLKSPLKGKRFQIANEIQKNRMGQLMVIGRTVWGPKEPTLKRTEVSLSCVQCFLYLVSSSINVSIFHITWLHTFWTDHVYYLIIHYFILLNLYNCSFIITMLVFKIMYLGELFAPWTSLRIEKMVEKFWKSQFNTVGFTIDLV